jgi:flagellar motor switch protein FliN/FliY
MALNKNTFGTEQYYSLWAQSIAQTISQFLGKEVAAETGPAADDTGADRLWVTFTITDVLLGEQAFSTTRADALYLGQLFIGEPADANAEFTADHADAFSELFRQFAGTAALQLKATLGTQCPVRFKDTQVPEWNGADSASIVIRTEKPVNVLLRMDTGLFNSVSKFELPPAEAQPASAPAVDGAEASQPGEAPQTEDEPGQGRIEVPLETVSRTTLNDKNLDLLLDVELGVSVRFGRRQMQLKDVLDLSSGAMVELDRRVRDPIELLLGGRVIARGEAVIVDGNYGIRITEIVSPGQRLAEIA